MGNASELRCTAGAVPPGGTWTLGDGRVNDEQRMGSMPALPVHQLHALSMLTAHRRPYCWRGCWPAVACWRVIYSEVAPDIHANMHPAEPAVVSP
jgi:hypothetical protein